MSKNLKRPKADIGILGGSGLYNLLSKPKKIIIDTPFGKPSDRIVLGKYRGKRLAFLPRHGEKHQLPPHKIPYHANLWAFKKLGIKQIIAPCASGSLTSKMKPGDFVICDQFIDRTKDRSDSFFDGPEVAHVPCADPYCPILRKIAIKACADLKISYHKKGTIIVIQGPRFSTYAESKWFQSQGWEVVNMTAYPEVVLARELQICYVNIALVTDYDTGLPGYQNIKPVTAIEVLRIFKRNERKVKQLILKMIDKIPQRRTCECSHILDTAFI